MRQVGLQVKKHFQFQKKMLQTLQKSNAENAKNKTRHFISAFTLGISMSPTVQPANPRDYSLAHLPAIQLQAADFRLSGKSYNTSLTACTSELWKLS